MDKDPTPRPIYKSLYAQVITAIKVKMLYVEPEQTAARRGG